MTPSRTSDRRLPAPKSAQRTDTTATVTRTGTLRSQMSSHTPVRAHTATAAAAAAHTTPQRTGAFERSRYSNVTMPIDRASESLEKINEVFR